MKSCKLIVCKLKMEYLSPTLRGQGTIYLTNPTGFTRRYDRGLLIGHVTTAEQIAPNNLTIHSDLDQDTLVRNTTTTQEGVDEGKGELLLPILLPPDTDCTGALTNEELDQFKLFLKQHHHVLAV